MAGSPEHEAQKRAIYERLSPRRRKFVDKIGYENWEPFAEPNDPIDIRTDEVKLTAHELVRSFLRSVPERRHDDAYAQGAFDLANGIINSADRYVGMMDFARWYLDFLREQGVIKD